MFMDWPNRSRKGIGIVCGLSKSATQKRPHGILFRIVAFGTVYDL